jgi:hypothetical protein
VVNDRKKVCGCPFPWEKNFKQLNGRDGSDDTAIAYESCVERIIASRSSSVKDSLVNT